jgi:hypothetical protein
MRGMALRLPLTLRRIAVSAALIAAGAAFFPVALLIDQNRFVGLFGLCVVAMAALPMAGVSVMFGRSWIETCSVFAVAMVMGVAFFFGFIS